MVIANCRSIFTFYVILITHSISSYIAFQAFKRFFFARENFATQRDDKLEDLKFPSSKTFFLINF